MRQYFKLLLLIVFQTMIWSQSSDNLFRVGVDYKSKIKIDTKDQKRLEEQIHELEYELYPEVIKNIASGKMRLYRGEVVKQ